MKKRSGSMLIAAAAVAATAASYDSSSSQTSFSSPQVHTYIELYISSNRNENEIFIHFCSLTRLKLHDPNDINHRLKCMYFMLIVGYGCNSKKIFVVGKRHTKK